MTSRPDLRLSRRSFLRHATFGGAVVAAPGWLGGPAAAQPAESGRPAVPYGVQSGDVGHDSAVVWSATDRPARMLVEYASS
jgi:alkaline phosphatase D